jgi:hypothetical protein
MAAPGNKPWERPSAINVMRRKIKKTPKGPEERAISKQAKKGHKPPPIDTALPV